MKIILNILKFLITVILSLCIIALTFIYAINTTILDKDFIFKKLEETNYYANTYTAVENDFKNYIYQSGLDEEVLNDIVSPEKIEKDTKTIINNIYDGANETIDVTEIANNLNNNIDESLNGRITATQRKAIDEFVNKITDQYKDTISHTNYEKSLNNMVQKANKVVDIGKKATLVGVIVSIILILLLSIKNIMKGFTMLGVGLVASGMFNIFVNILINTKVKIQNITILNDAISIALRDIISSVLNIITTSGYILLGVGVVIIVIFSIINAMKEKENT